MNNDYKFKFLDAYKNNIKREGSDKLLVHLMKSDFFTAPASTKYHEAYEGGLCEHSYKVYEKLKELLPNENPETLAICGLLHDICKINFYTVSYRNAKNETTGKWEKVPYYTIDDKFPYGHGEKSVYLIKEFMDLSLEEAMAIRWHMGAYEGEKVYNCLTKVFTDYKLPFYLHFADMKATYNK